MYQTSLVNNKNQTEILQKSSTLLRGLKMKKQIENHDATPSLPSYLLKFCGSSGTGIAL